MLTHVKRRLDDDALRVGKLLQRSLLGEQVADEADEDGNGHGDDHPDGGDTAGGLDLVLVLDRHEAQNDMRHTEVAETPCQRRNDRQKVIGVRAAGFRIVDARQREVARNRLCVVQYSTHTACLGHTEHDDADQRCRHDNGLDEVSEDRTDDHCCVVLPAEDRAEQLAAGRKARSSVGHEEDQDDQRSNAHEDPVLVMVAVGEEVRNGDRADLLAVDTQTLGNEQPVEIGADCQTDRSPAGFRAAGEVGNARKTHEQPAAHVGCLGAHGSDERTELSAAEVEVADILILFGIQNADDDHHDQIPDDRHGDDEGNVGHWFAPLRSDLRMTHTYSFIIHDSSRFVNRFRNSC